MANVVIVDKLDSAENLWRQTIASQVAMKFGKSDNYETSKLVADIVKFVLNGDPNG
jgi:hypothetical protein